MFVRSRMEKDVIYRRKGGVWVIKAGSVTFIDENKVTARELKSLYGSRIEIISRDKLSDEEAKIPVKKETKIVENKRKMKIESGKKPLDEALINDILTEIQDEIPAKKPEIKVEVIDPIKEAFMTGVGSEKKESTKTDEIGKDEIIKNMGLDELDGIKDIAPKKDEPVVEEGKGIPVLNEGEIGQSLVSDKPKRSSRRGPGKRARAKRASANK